MDTVQFAYFPNKSTDDAAIITLIHTLTQHIDYGFNYVRYLFINDSSAFNIMQLQVLINRRAEHNVPSGLLLFVRDFLTNRRQYVRTVIPHSSTNNGAFQACLLSAFFFIIYTNFLSLCSQICKIIKYTNDTVVLPLNKNAD